MFKLLIGIAIGLWIGLEFTEEIKNLIEIINNVTG